MRRLRAIIICVANLRSEERMRFDKPWAVPMLAAVGRPVLVYLVFLGACAPDPDAAIREQQATLKAIDFERRRMTADRVRRRGEFNASMIEFADDPAARKETLDQYRASERLHAELDDANREALDKAAERAQRKIDEIQAEGNPYRWLWRGTAPPPGESPPEPWIPWQNVTEFSEIKNLTSVEREAARNQYFVDVVAPRVPTKYLRATRVAFDRDTKRRTPASN